MVGAVVKNLRVSVTFPKGNEIRALIVEYREVPNWKVLFGE